MDQEVFSDWRRYRSAFSEAIELPAMSEHPSGVTMKRCSRPSHAVSCAASAERSSPDGISSSHSCVSVRVDASLRRVVLAQAAHRYSPAQVNTRRSSNDDPERYQPQIILSTLRPVAVIALLPGIFSMLVLW